MEERERNLYASQGRNEITVQGLQRDVKYHEEKVREYDKKIRQLEHNISEEIQLKERARLNLQVPIRFNARTNARTNALLDTPSTPPFIPARKNPINFPFPLLRETAFSTRCTCFRRISCEDWRMH